MAISWWAVRFFFHVRFCVMFFIRKWHQCPDVVVGITTFDCFLRLQHVRSAPNVFAAGFTQAIYTFGGDGRIYAGYRYDRANAEGSGIA